MLTDPASLPSCCLLVDYDMPAMKGIELIEELRQRLIDVPAILITGMADAATRALVARAGFRAVLEKPVLDEVLVSRIKTILRECEAQSRPT